MSTFSVTDDEAHSLIETGRAVVAREADALHLLSGALGQEFAQAAEMLLQCENGRVIVSGMGKSGHIARKIAATFSSTGTPAQFVHPAEASHGDLGMIQPGDVVVMLSNSGETPELGDLVTFCLRYTIPMIAISGRVNSTLVRQADVSLILPDTTEACGTGIVPTASTTMALALGDALAVALMQYRRFSPDQFRAFHPGGKLGARLLKVSDLMHQGDAVPLVPRGSAMGAAILAMSEKGFGVVGVTQGASLIGVITDGDLRRHLEGLLDLTVDDVMTRAPKFVAPDSLAAEAVGRMQGKITSLFVVAEGEVAGILRLHDCLVAGVV